MKDNQTYFSNLDKISYYDENGNDVDKIDENCNNVIEIEHNIEPIKEEKVFDDNFVWIDDTGKKYHKKSTCSNMDNPYQVSENDAINQSRSACEKCYDIKKTSKNKTISINNNIESKTTSDMVWIDDTGKKYHKKSTCSNMDNPYQVSKNDAISQGRDACKKCYR